MCEDDDECCCSRDVADRCFVIAVVSLISFCYFCYWYLIVFPWKWLSISQPFGLVNVFGLNFFFFLLCWSYIKTMRTSPGLVESGSYVPEGYTAEELESLKDMDAQLKKEVYLKEEHFYIPRWCRFCQHWKPPRSHHCREFNRCVLKLDHYCPWVYNAVGYRNHKFFILFLLYSSLCLTYFLICCVTRVIYDITYRQRGKMVFTIPEVILFIIQLILTLPVTIGIISLFCYQVSCLFSNCTNVETFALKRYKRGAKLCEFL
jgi:palmitoyltransferase